MPAVVMDETPASAPPATPAEQWSAAPYAAEAAPAAQAESVYEPEPAFVQEAAPAHEAQQTGGFAPEASFAPEPSFVPEQPQPFTPVEDVAPSGTRRWGRSDEALPVEVSDDEKRLHNDARRFARLLVSEIKLYNEQKVQEGRSQGDIYERLREDIDRSRQMYDKRVAPPVAARYDYFHQELVNTLAEGDTTKLGGDYPGATVAAG